MSGPDRELQEQFWDSWNGGNRTAGREIDDYTKLQMAVARRVGERLCAELTRPLRILDFGCGTGWLGAGLSDLGDVTGVDLSPASVDYGRKVHPEVTFLVGDLLSVEIEGPFDLAVSADVISHVADQQSFVDRVAELVAPGGTLVLMTQNGAIWRRNSQLAPQQPGQIRRWPTLAEIRTMLGTNFEIRRVGTIHPIGDRGALRVVNSRWISGPLRRIGLRRAWRRARELAGLGCEFTIEAWRR